jgi:WD40 repeat protein
MRGAYHYFRENVPWQEQADHFLSVVQGKGFHFYILDLEVIPKDGSTDFLADAEQWLKYVDEQVDGKVLLATGSFYLTKFGAAGEWMRNWPLMILQYPITPDRNGNPALPDGFREWKIWNYTDKGNGPQFGVGADRVYLLVYNGTPTEMRQWLGISAFSILNRTTNTVINPKQAIQLSTPNGMSFSPDGSYLAVATTGSVKLLDPGSGEEISALTISGRSVLSLNFLASGDTLAIGTDDGNVLLWDFSLLHSSAKVDSMIEVACSQVQQNLTQDEWTQYVGDGVPYQATCPNAPVP